MKNNKDFYPDSDNDAIRDIVRERYSEIAESDKDCCCGETCCTPDLISEPVLSSQLGYTLDDIASVPDGSNLGLGCGNPQAIANLKKGEVVVDLGSGGGFDCFLASTRVGQNGCVIGIDMTPAMIAKARNNARKGGYENVEFRLGEIEHIPVADNSADVIISNCVINLSPDKPQVFADSCRVLRGGGRLAISDIIRIGKLPEKFRHDPDAYCGCVSGAVSAEEIEKMLTEAGFVDIEIKIKDNSREFIKDWLKGSGVENAVCSANIIAHKPAR